MASPGAIIAHGTTPTGFGIRQRSNGNLRATSKCCGRTLSKMSGGQPKCNGCSETYLHAQNTLGASLVDDVEPDHIFVNTWVAAVTGYSEVTVQTL